MFRVVQNSLRVVRRAPRAFSTSTSRWTIDGKPPFDMPKIDMEAFQKTQMYKAVKENPEIVESIQKFGEVLKSKGISYSEPPSRMQMLKLGMDADFRTAFGAVFEGMSKSGVDLASPEVQQEMAKLMGMQNKLAHTEPEEGTKEVAEEEKKP